MRVAIVFGRLLLFLLCFCPISTRAERHKGFLAASRAQSVKAHQVLTASGYGTMSDQICNMYSKKFAGLTKESNFEKVCEQFDVRNLCTDFPAICLGNLGVRRCDMPQLPTSTTPDSAKWKTLGSSNGIDMAEANMSVGALVHYLPVQSFINRCSVCSVIHSGKQCFNDAAPTAQDVAPTAETCKTKSGCWCFWSSAENSDVLDDPTSSTLTVTEDSYILDGHHRWAAAKILHTDMMLPSNMPFVMERYSAAAGKPKATFSHVQEITKKAPELIKHTNCSVEAAAL